jgi:curved DNA-binding protein CbpA
MSTSTFYQILQIDPSADADVIKAAYVHLLTKYHPDTTTEADAAQRLHEITEAFATLSHPQKRSAYDAQLRNDAPAQQRNEAPKQQIILQNRINSILPFGFRSKQKLPIERDALAEELHAIQVVSCTAYYNNTLITVIGELAAVSFEPTRQYKEVHILAYDADGDVLARARGYWSPFGARQSFEVEVENAFPAHPPVKVKVFPSGHL